MIKEFILEYEDGLKQIIFFGITFALFLVAALHALKMKRPQAEEYAKLAIKDENEEGGKHE